MKGEREEMLHAERSRCVIWVAPGTTVLEVSVGHRIPLASFEGIRHLASAIAALCPAPSSCSFSVLVCRCLCSGGTARCQSRTLHIACGRRHTWVLFPSADPRAEEASRGGREGKESEGAGEAASWRSQAPCQYGTARSMQVVK
eukprot:1917286-Rhodomonas_salina.3